MKKRCSEDGNKCFAELFTDTCLSCGWSCYISKEEYLEQLQWEIKRMKTVCLDFDGVMNTYDGWMGPEYLFEPREGLKEFLSKLNEAGFKIVVNSTRTAKSIYGWLDEHNLRMFVDLVTDTKPPAVAYIDDRGICFRGNFDEVFEQLLKFKVFWEK
jgi:hypothetical protein